MDRCKLIHSIIQLRYQQSFTNLTYIQCRNILTANTCHQRRPPTNTSLEKSRIIQKIIDDGLKLRPKLNRIQTSDSNIDGKVPASVGPVPLAVISSVNDFNKVSPGLEDLNSSTTNLSALDILLQELDGKIKLMKSELDKLGFDPNDPDYKLKQMLLGKSDASVTPSNVPCGGCGALLHCTNPGIPGYMPAERFTNASEQYDLVSETCMRCEMLKKNEYLQVELDEKAYKTVIERIKADKSALVMMLVDVTDIANSLIKDYIREVCRSKPVVIVGNKIDLIPPDAGGQNHLNRLSDQILDACKRIEINPASGHIKDLFLISAKTGFGVEKMVDKLVKKWRTRGNVYLVGTTNSGKSTLFNKLLESDFCKSSCRDIVQRATISRLPGTTMDLLKFPLARLSFEDLHLRTARLLQQRKEDKVLKEKKTNVYEKTGGSASVVLFESVGKTDLRTPHQKELDEIKYKVTGGKFPEYTYKEKDDEKIVLKNNIDFADFKPKKRIIDQDEYPESQWVFDTPGLINTDQIINNMVPEELQLIMQMKMIRPRVYVIQPGDTMFITGMGRIDYLEGEKNTLATVHLMHLLPVRVVKTTEAGRFIEDNINTDGWDWLLKIPVTHENRSKKLPSLEGKQFSFTLKEHVLAEVDVQLSSLGWVSFAGFAPKVEIKVYTPGGKGIHLKTPALLPNILTFKGQRIKNTQAYAMRKIKPRFVSKKAIEQHHSEEAGFATRKVKQRVVSKKDTMDQNSLDVYPEKEKNKQSNSEGTGIIVKNLFK